MHQYWFIRCDKCTILMTLMIGETGNGYMGSLYTIFAVFL